MLYLGNFSYTDVADDEDNCCMLPAVVEADDADQALDRFEELFHRLHATSDLIDGAEQIYLDSLVELASAPTTAVLTQWQKVVPLDGGLSTITAPLPESEQVDATIYGDIDHDHDHDDVDDDDDIEEDEMEATPFMVFEEQ